LPVEGPVACLEVLRAGIAFAQARGLTESADVLMANTLGVLVETGEYEQALALASELAARYEASGNVLDLTMTRAEQATVLTLRGQAAQVADTLDWLETTTREAGGAEYMVGNLSAAAFARAALGQHDRAAALLTEIDSHPGSREVLNFALTMPTMIRTALALGNQELAQRLAAEIEPNSPHHEHALATVNAALAEANGDLQAAADGYADAAQRWHSFGVIPEQAFALLGHGRSLVALGRPAQARPVLHQAREIFQNLQAAPALAETDELLQQATALSS
jgi:ATP/maltotriose-dependent transcriptional regulator MalT